MKIVKVTWEYNYYTGEVINFEHIRQEILQNIEDRGYPVCWKHNVIWEKDMCHLCVAENEARDNDTGR